MNIINQDSQAPLIEFVDRCPLAIAVFDENMCYLAASRGWVDAFHITRNPLVGVSHYEVFPEIPERWRAVHRRALAGETITCAEDRFDRTDGSSHWLRWEVQPHRNAQGQGGIVIFSETLPQPKANPPDQAALLPICMHCKQIRGRSGRWESVDEHLLAHHGIRFSHSICPECLCKHYSGLDHC